VLLCLLVPAFLEKDGFCFFRIQYLISIMKLYMGKLLVFDSEKECFRMEISTTTK